MDGEVLETPLIDTVNNLFFEDPFVGRILREPELMLLFLILNKKSDFLPGIEKWPAAITDRGFKYLRFAKVMLFNEPKLPISGLLCK